MEILKTHNQNDVNNNEGGFFFLGKIGKKRNKLQIRLITHLDL